MTGDIFSLLETEIEAGNPYDVIWLQNVLEHVLDPLELLGQLRKLLRLKVWRLLRFLMTAQLRNVRPYQKNILMMLSG